MNDNNTTRKGWRRAELGWQASPQSQEEEHHGGVSARRDGCAGHRRDRQRLLFHEGVMGAAETARPWVGAKGAQKCHRKVAGSFLLGRIRIRAARPASLETLKKHPETQV